MAELFESIQVEGVGSEIVTAVALTTVVASLCSIIFFAWKTTCRRPLEFDMFLVEMHTMQRRRLVLHIAPNYDQNVGVASLIGRLRYRAQQAHPDDGRLLSISDTNIVIQAPSNIADPMAQSNLATDRYDRLTLWDIEMPPNPSVRPNPTRDSQIAAAAAITVLGRSVRDFTPSNQREQSIASDGTAGVQQTTTNSTLIHMQYMSPMRRRAVGYLSHFRTPIALTLGRDINQRQSSNRRVPQTLPTPSPSTSTPIQTENNENDCNDQRVSSESTVRTSDAPPGPTIQIRLKFLDDTEKIVQTELGITVLQFKRSNFPVDVRDGKVIRLIFSGKLLRDDSLSLLSYGLYDGAIVHCHISNTPYAQPQQPSSSSVQNVSRVHQTNTTGQNPTDIDRMNVWFFRIALAYFTNHLASFPENIRIRLQQLIIQHADSLRPSQRDNLFSNLWHHMFVAPWLEDEDPVEAAAAAAANGTRPICIGNYLLWIFGVQCALVWMFVAYFPQLCDRTAVGLLLLLTLYFFFVVVPLPYRRQSQQGQQQ